MAQNLLSIDDKMHGFTVTNVRRIEDLSGNLVEMVHDETGARLIWIDNGEENKLFSVGFKTLPEDSTGVFHILEHSVLCGSEKFPIKEPFVELLKTSMNTFLNAMTYPDKTLYPVSSRVRQDYLNLMEVYLDAVFCPSILTNPDIFYQEGWHIDTTEGEPAYKGVVFNEMKGAMSDVDQLAERTMLKMLFPDNCYGHNSGGDPDAIVDLTYEKFIEMYKRYYHPSNSYFYLDGDIPVDETLAMINRYLSGHERLRNLPRIVTQRPVATKRTIKYAAGSDEDKSLVVCSRIIGSWEDRDKMLAISVVLEQLADSNESVIKRAVLSSGLAEDMEIYVADGIDQPYIMIIFRGVDDAPRDAGKLLQTVCDAVAGAVSEGLSKADFEASINQLDFRFRQYPEPQALYRVNSVFASWLYGGDPAMYLETAKSIANLREMLDEGEFEKIAKDVFGDTKKFSTLCMKPDINMSKTEAEAEASFVKSMVQAMSSDERAALEQLNADLLSWQQTPDSDEDISKIPRLDLSDISQEPEHIETEEREEDGITILYHPVQSNGIVYINAYFPLTDLTAEELSAATLMVDLYKDLPTENYDVLALQNAIRMHVGAMSFDTVVMARDNDRDSCTPCIKVSAAVLKDKVQYARDLMIEILTRTIWDNKSQLKELISQLDEEIKRNAQSAGHKLAVYAARTHWTSKDAAGSMMSGYSYMQYLHKMSGASDAELDEFIKFAERTAASSIVKQNIKLSVTGTDYVDISGIASMLPNGEAKPESAAYTTNLPRRLGIAIPSSVSYTGLAYDMSDSAMPMSGQMAVACNIIGLSHLWNEIRVQGGAYGANMNFGRAGSLSCWTYRDPSPARSLEVFKTIPDFIKELTESGDLDIEGYIISTIASIDPLLSPAAKGSLGDDHYYSEHTYEDRLRYRTEMLEATAQDLAGQYDALRKMAAYGSICVVGPREALESVPGLEIVEL